MSYYISSKDLEERCWWCGSKIKGFDTELGRNVVGKYKHFCSDKCVIVYNECDVKTGE